MNIVLAHGILGFKNIGHIYYFNGVQQHLEDKYNAKVLITKVDPTGGNKERGGQLSQQILEALGENGVLNPEEETHIIAHSMGGLDSRYILSPKTEDNIAEFITSLTTIGTPHRGSPIADWLYPMIGDNTNLPFLGTFENPAQKFLETFDISVDGLRDLTTEISKAFDNYYEDSNDISYFWTAGISRSGPGFSTSVALLPTYEYMKQIGHSDNDGAVPLWSASHGEAIGRPWLADHLDEVGHDLDNLPEGTPRRFDYLERYDEIIDRISPLKKLKKEEKPDEIT
jgi:triacylglycerol lipase